MEKGPNSHYLSTDGRTPFTQNLGQVGHSPGGSVDAARRGRLVEKSEDGLPCRLVVS
jgi:hypothetical protein